MGRTDLRIGVSRTKFDAQADFEIRLPPALPKTHEPIKKLREIFDKKNSIFFQKLFDDILSGRKHPNESECLRTYSNRSQHVPEATETSKILGKLRETRASAVVD